MLPSEKGMVQIAAAWRRARTGTPLSSGRKVAAGCSTASRAQVDEALCCDAGVVGHGLELAFLDADSGAGGMK